MALFSGMHGETRSRKLGPKSDGSVGCEKVVVNYDLRDRGGSEWAKRAKMTQMAASD